MKTEKKFTTFHRILHWLIAFAMPILYITGFLRLNWMNKHHIVSVIESKTSALPQEQMIDIATTIRAPMWEWHIVFAHVVIFSFLARIIYMIVKGVRFPNPFKRNIPALERIQGFTYVYFYVFLMISAVTGISIRQELFPQWEDGIEAIHKLGLYWFPIFVLLHFAGIIIAEFSNKKGIVSKMIGGE